jgi:hypothetical protein
MPSSRCWLGSSLPSILAWRRISRLRLSIARLGLTFLPIALARHRGIIPILLITLPLALIASVVVSRTERGGSLMVATIILVASRSILRLLGLTLRRLTVLGYRLLPILRRVLVLPRLSRRLASRRLAVLGVLLLRRLVVTMTLGVGIVLVLGSRLISS